MDNKYLNEVLERLESYRKKEQQIELLRYELQHAKQVSPTELIEAMTFQTRDADASQTDLYPKDVPGIALSYQHIAAQLNEEAVGELMSRYTAYVMRETGFCITSGFWTSGSRTSSESTILSSNRGARSRRVWT